MKMSISAKSVAGLGLFIAAAFLLEAGAEHQFEAIRLRTGRFEYRMVKAGKEIAKFNLTVERQRAKIVVSLERPSVLARNGNRSRRPCSTPFRRRCECNSRMEKCIR